MEKEIPQAELCQQANVQERIRREKERQPLASITDDELRREFARVRDSFTAPAKMLIITVGLPRSGKSTWCRLQSAPMVNPDAIRLALHGRRFAAEAEPFTWAIAGTMTRALFGAGHQTVIVDATNVSAKRRKLWEDIARECGAALELKVFETSSEECKRRAIATGQTDLLPVIDRMQAEWDLPRPSGW